MRARAEGFSREQREKVRSLHYYLRLEPRQPRQPGLGVGRDGEIRQCALDRKQLRLRSRILYEGERARSSFANERTTPSSFVSIVSLQATIAERER